MSEDKKHEPGCPSYYAEYRECWCDAEESHPDTAEQRLAEAVGYKVDPIEEIKAFTQFGSIADFATECEVRLWSHALRLERENQVMREALESVLSVYEREHEPDVVHNPHCCLCKARAALSQIRKPQEP